MGYGSRWTGSQTNGHVILMDRALVHEKARRFARSMDRASSFPPPVRLSPPSSATTGRLQPAAAPSAAVQASPASFQHLRRASSTSAPLPAAGPQTDRLLPPSLSSPLPAPPSSSTPATSTASSSIFTSHPPLLSIFPTTVFHPLSRCLLNTSSQLQSASSHGPSLLAPPPAPQPAIDSFRHCSRHPPSSQFPSLAQPHFVSVVSVFCSQINHHCLLRPLPLLPSSRRPHSWLTISAIIPFRLHLHNPLCRHLLLHLRHTSPIPCSQHHAPVFTAGLCLHRSTCLRPSPNSSPKSGTSEPMIPSQPRSPNSANDPVKQSPS